MAEGRHSYVAFYMDKWAAGTAGLPRLAESVYFQICRQIWDKARPVSMTMIDMMTSDLAPGQGRSIVDALIEMGKLVMTDDGVSNPKALEEARRALELYQKKSRGGRAGSATTNAGKAAAGSDGETPAETRPSTRLDKTSLPTEEEGEASPLLSASADDPDGEQPPEADEPDEDKPEPTTDDMQVIAKAWNEMALANGLAQISKMTEKRRTALRARIKDHGRAHILEAITRVPFRPFLMGQNDRGWKADIDWLLRPDSVVRINEGGYTGKSGDGGWMEA